MASEREIAHETIKSERKDRRLQFWAFMALLIATVVSYGLLGHHYIVTSQEIERQNKELLVLAKKAREQAAAVQEQRRDFIRRSCESQNTRHKDLENFLKDQGTTQEENPTVYIFIDKLAPLQDCDALVKEATTTPEGG